MGMTRQEIYNKAYLGLASQGWVQSINDMELCQYRSGDGRKCAVGWLIPDDKYEKSMENTGIGQLIRYREFDCIAELAHEERFLSQLQSAHDEEHIPDNMKARFEAIAIEWGLEIPKVNS
jgi:hypothetical protein